MRWPLSHRVWDLGASHQHGAACLPILYKNIVPHTLQPNEHPYLNGAWTPNYCEYTATDMEVIGRIPADIDGVYLRNTENPVPPSGPVCRIVLPQRICSGNAMVQQYESAPSRLPACSVTGGAYWQTAGGAVPSAGWYWESKQRCSGQGAFVV